MGRDRKGKRGERGWGEERVDERTVSVEMR